MTDVPWIVLRHILIMSAYMMLGFTLYRIKLMSSEGSRCIANLLVRVVIPCMIVKSCLVDYSSERLIQFGISFGLGIVSLLMTMLVSKLLLRKNPVEELAAAFSNAGFIGIPLTAACFGANAAVYAQLYDADYTYACSIVTQSTLLSIVTLPLMLALAEAVIT